MIIERFPELLNLPLEDKQRLVCELLGEIDEELVPTPDWVMAVLDERIAAYEADPEGTSVPWEEVKERMLSLRRRKLPDSP